VSDGNVAFERGGGVGVAHSLVNYTPAFVDMRLADALVYNCVQKVKKPEAEVVSLLLV